MPQLATQTPPVRSRSKGRKPATTRIVNVRLLVVTIVVISIVLPLTYVWYRYQVSRTAGVFLSRATALEEEQQWEKAAAFRARYLQLRPDDVEERLRMVDNLSQVLQTPRSRRRLSSRLYEALGLAPERHDLRVKLADNLLELGDFAAAEEQAQKVLASSAEADEKRSARRILALALRAQASPGGKISIEQAAQALSEALADSPGDVQLASLTANLYREYPDAIDTVDTVDSDVATLADRIMDELVAHDPRNPDALMARHNYRARHGLPGAKLDLREALQCDPNHVEALLAAATAELRAGLDGDRSKAEEYLRRVIETAPQDPRGYTSLARLLSASQNRDAVLRVLQEGRDAVGTDNLDINSELLVAYLNANDLDKAQIVLDGLDDAIRSILPEVSTPSRLRLENYLRLQRARLELARGDSPSAIRNLRAIITAVGDGEQLSESSARFQALVLLAETMGQLERWDLAATYWETLTDEMELESAYWEALPDGRSGKKVFQQRYFWTGRAFLQAGQTAEAIERLEKYRETMSPSFNADAHILLLRSHLVQQIRRPARERNWSEFVNLLGTTRNLAPDRWEPIILQSEYLTSLGTDEARQMALVLLRDAQPRFSDNKDFWASLVARYQQLGRLEDAEKALEKFTQLESDPTRQSTLRAVFLAGANKIGEAERLLSELSATLAEEDQAPILLDRGQLLVSAGKLTEARKLLSEAAKTRGLLNQEIDPNEVHPGDEKLLIAGIEIALMQEDYETAKEWEQQLAKLELADDFQVRFVRARRLLSEIPNLDDLDLPAQGALATLVNSLRTERPRWYPAVALAARHAERLGNRREAITELQLANALGDNRIETLESLVRLLNSEGRTEEAQSYLARLTAVQMASTQGESLAISAAVQQNRIQEAIKLAQQSIKRHPQDATPRIWLANLYVSDNQQEKAAQILQESLEKFPDNVGVKSAYVAFLARNQRTDEARRLLEQLPDHFVAAQGYEVLGDREAARAEYQAAIGDAPDRIDIRLRYARLLMSNDVAGAREQYAAILKLDPENVAAKRQLATLLAATGRDDDWNQAIQLLRATEDSSTPATADDYRLRAVLLTRRGKTRDERLSNLAVARGLLSEQLNRDADAADDTDRLLLASINEQEALLSDDVSALEAARQQLRRLLDREPPSRENLLLYVQFLLRHAQSPLLENGATARDDAAKIRADYLSDARLRLDELQSLVEAGDAGSAMAINTVGLQAQLLNAEGRPDEAVQVLGEFASRQEPQLQNEADRARFYLAMGNICSNIEQHAEAQKWYRELMSIAPNGYVALVQSLARQGKVSEAIDLCLRISSEKPAGNVAAILAQLAASAPDDSEIYQRIQPAISAALDTDAENVDLLMSVAVMHVTRNETERAIDLFQRILKLAPDNTVALNNLATLLGERSNRHAEALEYVDRAMSLAGRIPALLDTRGTILLNAGRSEEAVACLEEATAGRAVDPRYYFHLALAYQQAGQDDRARESLRLARERGLDTAILTEGDRVQLAALEQELRTKTEAN